MFVNCGAHQADREFVDGGEPGQAPPDEPLHTLIETPEVAANLRQFVEGGGRLYVTDWAYDVFEHALPEVVDFAGGDGDGLSMTPEAVDQAQRGGVSELSDGRRATVGDADLAAWLGQVGVLEPDGTLLIQDMMGSWAVMERVDESEATTWVSADASWFAPGVDLSFDEDPLQRPTEHGHIPLTVSAKLGCGRGFVTSYHTVDLGSSSPPNGGFYPQELVLAYTILEVGSCIEEPILR